MPLNGFIVAIFNVSVWLLLMINSTKVMKKTKLQITEKEQNKVDINNHSNSSKINHSFTDSYIMLNRKSNLMMCSYFPLFHFYSSDFFITFVVCV